MDLDVIVQYVASVGFPIVFCFLLNKQNNEIISKNTDTINELKTLIEKLIEKEG